MHTAGLLQLMYFWQIRHLIFYCITKKPDASIGTKMLVAGQDSNLQPSGYEPDELPNFHALRFMVEGQDSNL